MSPGKNQKGIACLLEFTWLPNYQRTASFQILFSGPRLYIIPFAFNNHDTLIEQHFRGTSRDIREEVDYLMILHVGKSYKFPLISTYSSV